MHSWFILHSGVLSTCSEYTYIVDSAVYSWLWVELLLIVVYVADNGCIVDRLGVLFCNAILWLANPVDCLMK